MSTNLRLECNSHNPPQQSDDVGTSISDLKFVFDLIDNRIPLKKVHEVVCEDRSYYAGLGGWAGVAASFFHWHPTCELKVVDEYGHYHTRDEVE